MAGPIFVIYDGQKEGTLEVGHEWLSLDVPGNDFSLRLRLQEMASFSVEEKSAGGPGAFEIVMHMSSGEAWVYKSDFAQEIVAAIPRSYHLGW